MTKNNEDVPGSRVVKNQPASVKDMSSIPGPGRFHMLWGNQACASQLVSLCSGAGEPQLLKPAGHNEKPAHHNESSPHSQR